MISCTKPEVQKQQIKIKSVQPLEISSGTIRITGKGFPSSAVVRLNGDSLATTFESSTTLAADVPPTFVREPGFYPLTVETESGQLSNTVSLHVIPTHSEPLIKQFFPDPIRAGQSFNTQPDGGAALGIVGANFLSGAVVEINGQLKKTTFTGNTQLTVEMPDSLFAQPGELRITVRNPDGRISQPVALKIIP